MRPVLLSALVVSCLLLAGLPAQGSASPVEGSSGVCAGVPGCDVKAKVDVNGDGNRDPVGITSRGTNANRRVIVRVKITPERIVTMKRDTPYWSGSHWQGASNLDGRPGKEIVVGKEMGAHTQFYFALTWRHGRLVVLNAPGSGRFWMIDGAIWISAGWKRSESDPTGTIRQRIAVRTGDTKSPFRGTITTYTWRDRGWRQVDSKSIRPLPDRKAYRWGGFHVPGLHRW